MNETLRVDNINIFLTPKYRRVISEQNQLRGLWGYFVFETEKAYIIYNLQDNKDHYLYKSCWNGECYPSYKNSRESLERNLMYNGKIPIFKKMYRCVEISRKEYNKIVMTLEMSK